MFFRQYYLGCLSHACYLIGDDHAPGGRSSSIRSATSTSTSPTPPSTG